MLGLDRCRKRPRWLGVGLAYLAFSATVFASSVDGAARIVIIPLVVSGLDRGTLVTIFNPGPEPIGIDSLYVGAEGTPQAGEHACNSLTLPASSSRTLPLQAICPVATPDVENFGYLELTSRADASKLFTASAWVETMGGSSFAIEGYPLGAFDPSWDNGDALRVASLDGEVIDPNNPRPIDQRAVCFVATRTEPKDLELIIEQGFGQPVTRSLRPRQMMRVDVFTEAGLSPGPHARLGVNVRAKDPGLVIAGCATEAVRANTLDYRLAQTSQPKDTSRLRRVELDTGVTAGPYVVAMGFGTPTQTSKVVLGTYLHTEDQLRCRLVQPVRISPNFDPTPWLELRVIDPDGVVRAGGDRATDTGVFETGVRNALRFGRYQNRWRIEISIDEASVAQVPYPSNQTFGLWGLDCQSAAGMSRPMPVADHQSKPFPDDF